MIPALYFLFRAYDNWLCETSAFCGKCNEKENYLESKDSRKEELLAWLKQTGVAPQAMQALPQHASVRRYFRVQTAQGSMIAMDAPPPHENCTRFVRIADALRAIGLATPEIVAQNCERGYLLLSDFGDQTYYSVLTPDNVDHYYRRALDALCTLQQHRVLPGVNLAAFNAEWMWQEWQWHQEWFLNNLLGISFSQQQQSLDHCMHLIIDSALQQPQVVMHRDYHTMNLMVLPSDEVGVLDFQDAFIGPITYDLVSLLCDCYVDWPAAQVAAWVSDYVEALTALHVITDVSTAEFKQWFDWMGIQRHLKALFTFARKQLRDQQSVYLTYVPRTLHYIVEVSRDYPTLAPLHQFYQQVVIPAWEQLPICEA